MDLNFFKNYSPYDNVLKRNKLASVLIPLVKYQGEEHILFETRALHLNNQPGEVSFPGGKIEAGESPRQAAIRETMEELGCLEKDIEIVGQSDFFVTVNGILLHPFVGRLKYYDNYPINKSEVEDVFLVPLKFFWDNEPEIFYNSTQVKADDKFPYNYIEEYLPSGKKFEFLKSEYAVHFYKYKGKLIWGMSAAIIKNFVDILKFEQK